MGTLRVEYPTKNIGLESPGITGVSDQRTGTLRFALLTNLRAGETIAWRLARAAPQDGQGL